MTPLRRRMIEDMQVRNLSLHTQASYVQQVSLFARHFGKSPELLGPEEIRSYQVYLTNEKKLTPSSIGYEKRGLVGPGECLADPVQDFGILMASGQPKRAEALHREE